MTMHARLVDLTAVTAADPDASSGAGLADADLADLANLRVLVVGSGLIGTSVGMALRRHGTDVLLHDRRPAQTAVAASRGAGRVWPFPDPRPAGIVRPRSAGGADDLAADVGALVADARQAVDHVVIAVPPRDVGRTLLAWQRLLPEATFSDTASVKVEPLTDAERLGADMSRICGAHPVAGRERGGPEWALQDLFANRPWVITPSAATSPLAERHARLVAVGCGAWVTRLDPHTHDFALGLLSHLPHIVASAIAARLAGMPEDLARLAGPGLMDFTRIAGANADLWTEIVEANASPLADLLDDVIADLGRVRDALGAGTGGGGGAAPVVESLFQLGNTGRDRLEAARSLPTTRGALGERLSGIDGLRSA
ncbi:prephenate dehydrogenase/arogenate dehydrogenase family protein [Frankia sp. CNm7]|uniref:Prephenate dehydrogenase/arogenate dehydrogenase family protein n=1 Tax=Frankia nepalensis TaxID=1836974 RepID=A0A937UP93_9ACTN|nr:prephenate dehydrogenase/arogenate dehydrogenase family protein [Frankia nepalensis]MBL7500398.1 prephenate dehydrogenase/arogenate dehydrogenase family protein [Frankia nepalensis]MBL7508696.1 prephenate dehydrogenase/arogenate dehydrogenase family protein [Frankia nepalensis]MBL7520670.1 prephenate dehydrogenase/arogenate dehydrogenase family protein [Frankia nepalensis]MBL7628858.1 prephenate dehydrogenase/arogenate dehydrogenase family protein [Frankia nepalensis]